MRIGTHLLYLGLVIVTIACSTAVPTEAAAVASTCSSNDDVCTMAYSDELEPWLHALYLTTVQRRRAAENHPFIAAISAGEVSKTALVNYFQGMYWHVARSGHLFVTLSSRRPPSVAVFIKSIKGRVSDGHSSAEALQATDDSFRALIQALGGDFLSFKAGLDSFSPPYEWFLHNAQLRAAIYSADFSWEVGTAAMSAGTEGVVPWYCGPLAAALQAGYGIGGTATAWLTVRGGEEARRHADNGFKVLSHFVTAGGEGDEGDKGDKGNKDNIKDGKKTSECALYVDRLGVSMSKTLLDCGLRLAKEEKAEGNGGDKAEL